MTTEQKRASLVVVLCPDTGEPLSNSRRGEPDQVGVIGGKPEGSETALECAMREFYEETGVQLKDAPVLIMEGVDSFNFFNSVYLVISKRDIVAVQEAYKGITKEVEKDIYVSYNSWIKLLNGPFGQFNAQLLCVLMNLFSKEMMLKTPDL